MDIFKIGRPGKKASLQLSINAIVILILAITILGLGLGFIKKQFGSVTKQFSAVSEQITEEMKQRVKESGELLAMSKTDFTLQRGKTEEFYVGIRNSDNTADLCYKLDWACIGEMGEDTCSITDADTWFSTLNKKIVTAGETDVLKAIIDVPGSVGASTYLIELALTYASDCTATTWSDYSSKEFYVTLS